MKIVFYDVAEQQKFFTLFLHPLDNNNTIKPIQIYILVYIDSQLRAVQRSSIYGRGPFSLEKKYSKIIFIKANNLYIYYTGHS